MAMPAASIAGSRYPVKSGSLCPQSARWNWLNRLGGQGEDCHPASSGMEKASSIGIYGISGSLPFIRWNEPCRLRPSSGQDGRLEDFLAPLAEAGRSGGLRGARLGVVQALVLGDHHVDRGLRHRGGHPGSGQPVLEGLAWNLLVADRLAEHL